MNVIGALIDLFQFVIIYSFGYVLRHKSRVASFSLYFTNVVKEDNVKELMDLESRSGEAINALYQVGCDV